MNVILRRLGRQQRAIETYLSYIERDVGGSIRQTATRHPLAPLSPCLDDGPVQVSVVCVKWGTKYGVEYVEKLYQSVVRNLDARRVKVTFYCLTDDVTAMDVVPAVHCLRLQDTWQGWWNKIELFSPAIAAQLGGKGSHHTHTQCRSRVL
jgi:hypothetical protein